MTDANHEEQMARRILIVEDSATQAERLRFLIESNEYRSQTARNGREALEVMDQDRPDIVISDIVMPEMDGYELCRRIKQIPALKAIPVVLLTSLSDPLDVMRGLECGADSFIFKPYDERDLLARVAYVLANSHLRATANMQMGLEIVFAGKKFFITSDRLQILNLLLSTYEAAVLRNQDLASARDELRQIAADLENRVRARTSELVEAQRRQALILESIAEGLHGLDLEGRIIFENPAALTMFGFGPDEMVGRSAHAMIHHHLENGDPYPVEECPIYQTIRDGVTRRVHDELFFTKDGRPFPVEYLASAMRDEAGAVVGAVVAFRDITERRSAVAALRAQVRQQESAAVLAREALNLSLPELFDQTVRVISETLEVEFTKALELRPGGASLRLVAGTGWRDARVGVTEVPTDLNSQAGFTLLSAQPVIVEDLASDLRFRGPELLTSHGVVSGLSVVVRAGGKMWGVLGAHTTKRREFSLDAVRFLETVAAIVGGAIERAAANAEVADTANRFRSLVEATTQMVWWTDSAGYVTGSIPSWQAYTGQTDEEVQGHGAASAIHQDDVAHALATWQLAVAAAVPYDTEYRVRGRGGEYRHFAARGIPVHRADGGVREWIGTCTDIHDRKLAESKILQLNVDLERRVASRTAELEAANKELESFSYSVSHDLRAPLRRISGFASILEEEEGARLSEESRRHLATIMRGARHMTNLIDDLLTFSRVGSSEFKWDKVELETLLDQVLVGLEGEMQGRNIVWRREALPVVEGDRGMLRQVLVNLVSNAIKYTKTRDCAEIEIGASGDDSGKVVVHVRDNGAGFDPKHAHRLFGVFQRLHTDTEFEGTGIGLANVRRIIQRHGGRTWAEGELNRGATFYFELGRTRPNA